MLECSVLMLGVGFVFESQVDLGRGVADLLSPRNTPRGLNFLQVRCMRQGWWYLPAQLFGVGNEWGR